MFWKENIAMSKHLYNAASPTMLVCRIFGLLPVGLRKEKDQIYLKWSPFYALYSVFLALFLVFLTYRGVLEDILCEKKDSVRIKSDVDMYVVFTDLATVQLIMTFGIFVSVFKISDYFKFLTCLREIDIIMRLSQTKSARKTSICIMFVLLLVMVSISIYDILIWSSTTPEDSVKSKILPRYITVYTNYSIVLIIQYRFWYLGSPILRKLRQLNEKLDNLNEKDPALGILSEDYILTITTVYMKLAEATNFLNQFLGMVNTITILDILWHFVECPYRLVLGITRPTRSASYILLKVAWNLFHMSRLLILVEPCHSCKLEVQKMKVLICKLLCSRRISQECRLQLQIFSTVLDQCKLQFSASGIKEIDRSLITVLVGTVSTYLVILIQFPNNQELNN